MSTILPFQISDSQLRLELDYGWEFVPDPSGRLGFEQLGRVTGWRPARAGLSWNVQFEDLREYMGAAWYRIRFEIPFTRNVQHVLLKFGAVDYYCEVFLNGQAIGSHEGGYTPFSFDVSRAANHGENELAIRVIDPPMDEKQNQELFPDMLYNEIPHGKQNWYVQNSGIWQGVRLELTPAIYVDRVDVTPKMDGRFRLAIRLNGGGLEASPESVAETTLRAVIHDNAGRVVWDQSSAISGTGLLNLDGAVQNPKLWGPEQPALYTVDVQLQGAIQYRRRARFGFRELRAEDGKLLLNGKPFFMIAALDQDFYPETIHTPASEEFIRDMMLKAKRLGINTLRCHLKVAHPVYLDVANELGMLVWAELPSWSDCWFPADHFSRKAAARCETTFQEMMWRDWNHPCLVIQTIINESWGIDLSDAEQRNWLKTIFEKIRGTLAPLGRLVVDNSACEGNFHLKTDIEDFHNYYSQPDQADLWDAFIADFSRHPSWTYSSFGDAERTGNEPLVVSEFGNWGLPALPDELPWWFNQSFGEREVTRPAGVLERFHEYKLDRIFSDYHDLAYATQRHQFASLQYEIESMRSQPAIQGYCVTGMTDVHWEVNGLLDMWRNEKAFTEDLRRLQQPDVLMARSPRFNFYAGETVEIPVVLSHFSQRELADARLQWTIDGGISGSFDVPYPVAAGSVTELGALRFEAPSVTKPSEISLRLALRGRAGFLLCENSYTVFVYPRLSQNAGTVFLHDPLGTAKRIAEFLRDSGHDVRPLDRNAAHDSVILASAMDEQLARHLRNGCRALIVANSEQAIAPELQLSCLPRKGNWLDGRWFSNFNWIDPSAEPYRELAFQRILGFESRAVVPDYVISGAHGEEFDHAIAGITLGWIQMNHPLALRIGVGAGRALLTTFRFDRDPGDPYGAHLLRSYLQYATSGEWPSSLQLEMQDA